MFDLTFKPPATRLVTDLSLMQHKMAAGRVLRCFRERKKIDIDDDGDILERYRFNRNTVLYITDFYIRIYVL